MERKKLAEGKTKIIWSHGDPNTVIIESKDDITAGDGERRDVIKGKSILATTTTVNCFRLLNRHGIRTHFKNHFREREFFAHRVNMIPVEVVVRRIATGSFRKRRPDVEEGTILPYLVELFLKDDLRHDPLIIHDFVSLRTLLFDPKKPLKDGFIEEQHMDYGPIDNYETLRTMADLAMRSFAVLETAWAQRDVTLVDLKIECGVGLDEEIVVADVIDNDSWRIWPAGDKAQMKDKQVYRNLESRTPEELGKIKENYAWVAEETSKFLD